MEPPSSDRRRAARPLGIDLELQIHIGADLIERIDRWLARYPGTFLTRADIARHAIEEWLDGQDVPDEPADR